MADFSITSQTMTSQTAIVRLAGAVDDLAFDLIEDEFSKLLDSGILGMALDFSRLENITSDSLGAVLNLGVILGARGGKIAVGAPPEDIAETIRMLGVETHIGLEETIEAARKAVTAAVR